MPAPVVFHNQTSGSRDRPLSILVAPDKFKGTLSAGDAAAAMARGWRKARPEDRIRLLPISDGGDGFGQVTSDLLGATVQNARALDAAHQPCTVHWWWAPVQAMAIVESARVIGLAMLPAGKFHPFELDTFGLGTVIQKAAAHGATQCLIGIGGSATNDGGFGLARALGWQFLDRTGQAIESWTRLPVLHRIKPPKHRVAIRKIMVAVDVQNPLLGMRGATRVYGPQKGVRPPDVKLAEASLERLAKVWRNEFGSKLDLAPGSGAAGGLGFGLAAFLGARLEPGFDLFARLAALDRTLAKIDLVLTGEGALDASTLMGKGVGQLALRCRKRKIPCVALAGQVASGLRVQNLFAVVRGLTDLTSRFQAQSRTAYWIERLAEIAAAETKGGDGPFRPGQRARSRGVFKA